MGHLDPIVLLAAISARGYVSGKNNPGHAHQTLRRGHARLPMSPWPASVRANPEIGAFPAGAIAPGAARYTPARVVASHRQAAHFGHVGRGDRDRDRDRQDLAEKGLFTIGVCECERAAFLAREAARPAHFDRASRFHMTFSKPPAVLCLDRSGNRKHEASENESRPRNRDASRSAMHGILLPIWDRGEEATSSSAPQVSAIHRISLEDSTYRMRSGVKSLLRILNWPLPRHMELAATARTFVARGVGVLICRLSLPRTSREYVMKLSQIMMSRRALFATFGSSLGICHLDPTAIYGIVSQTRERSPDMQSKSRQMLDALVHSSDFTGRVPANTVQELANAEATTVSGLMVRLLALARTYSHAPISNYHVGAVARGLSGSVYLGMNVEIPHHSLGFSVHGEQAALSNAYMHGEDGVCAIAVTAAPCGHCRQFMNEVSPAGEIEVLIDAKAPVKLFSLLPMAFGPRDLGFQHGAFPVTPTKLVRTNKSDDELVFAALDAAEHAHAPYSDSVSGVAIRTKTGKVYKGSYLENAALNPSLSPLQTALVQLTLAGYDYGSISRVVLVEAKEAKISQASVTTAVLSSIAPRVELQIITVDKG